MGEYSEKLPDLRSKGSFIVCLSCICIYGHVYHLANALKSFIGDIANANSVTGNKDRLKIFQAKYVQGSHQFCVRVVEDVKHLTEGPHKKRHSSTFIMAALSEIIRLLEKAKKELNKGRYPLQEISSKYLQLKCYL